MRKLFVQVREADSADVLRLADEHGGFAPTSAAVERDGEPGWRSLHLNLPNEAVGRFIDAVTDRVGEGEFVLDPQGTLPLRTPLGDMRDTVVEVSRRSTLELVLDSLQSVGAWPGLLVYAFVSGVVAAYGVIFDTPYLLTAAMLIAPMGAPAMVAVVGVAVGDGWMVRRGALRFAVALLVTAAAAAGLGAAYGLEVSTETMESISSLSNWAVLLAIAGGAAGAQSLVRSDRDSMVTATATGFLVAVALSPPAAVLGLSIPMARWDYAAQMGYVLLLTFFGVVAGGAISLMLVGVGAEDTTVGRGRSRLRPLLAGAAVVAAALLAGWQTLQAPRFEKADLARQGVQLTREAAAGVPAVRLIEANARFTRQDADWHRGEGLLVQVVAQRVAPGPAEDSLRARIGRLIRQRLPNVEPFVDVSVLPLDAAPIAPSAPRP